MLQPVPLMAAPADVPGSEQGPTSSSHHLPGPLSDPQQTTPGSLSTVQPSSNSMSSSVLQLSAFSTAADARAISGARRRRGSAGAGQTAKHIFSRLTGSHTSKVTSHSLVHYKMLSLSYVEFILYEMSHDTYNFLGAMLEDN